MFLNWDILISLEYFYSLATWLLVERMITTNKATTFITAVLQFFEHHIQGNIEISF